MNMQKIKKNYPYKKTTAIVLRIMRKTYKNNSLSNNDRVDELLLHKEQVGFLEQSNLIDDIDEFRRLYDWYNYVLLVEFIDYKGEKIKLKKELMKNTFIIAIGKFSTQVISYFLLHILILLLPL